MPTGAQILIGFKRLQPIPIFSPDSRATRGEGNSESCTKAVRSAHGILSPLVGEGKHSSPRYRSEMGEGSLGLRYLGTCARIRAMTTFLCRFI